MPRHRASTLPIRPGWPWALALVLGLCLTPPADAALGGKHNDWSESRQANEGDADPVQLIKASRSTELDQLEQRARGNLQSALADLNVLNIERRDDPESHINLLTLRALLLSQDRLSPVSMQVAEQIGATLEAWPNEDDAALASASAMFVRGMLMWRLQQPTAAAEARMQEALARLPADTPAAMHIRIAAELASLKQAQGKLDQALALISEAIRLADTIPVNWRSGWLRTRLAAIHLDIGQPKRALDLANEALTYAEPQGDLISQGRAHNLRAIVLSGQGQASAASAALDSALRLARQAGAVNDESLFLSNLSDQQLKAQDYRAAMATAKQSIRLARSLGDEDAELTALANLGLAEIALGDVQTGKLHVQQAIAIDARRGQLNRSSATYRELGEALETKQDLQGAVAAFHEYRRLSNTLMRQTQVRAIAEAQERYDAERRAKEIETLSRETQITELKTTERHLQQRVSWLVNLALVLALAVIWLLVRKMRRKNKALARKNALLENLAERDELTGLTNRRRAQALMSQRWFSEAAPGCLVFIDIDHFKALNDEHGHAAGDDVLVEVAKRLRVALRDGDTIARWGGEEFLVAARVETLAQSHALAARLLNAIGQKPYLTQQKSLRITASIGFAMFPLGSPTPSPCSPETALQLVDQAMYLAKSRGRNCAVGIASAADASESALALLASGLQAASHEGLVVLSHLDGPEPINTGNVA